MSFYNDNENFIKIKILKETRSFTHSQKIDYYKDSLKGELLLRIKKYFEKSKKNLSGIYDSLTEPNLFSHSEKIILSSVEDYREILGLLSFYDFELILTSIYFETFSNQIFEKLKDEVLKNIPENFEDRYNILEIFSQQNNSEKTNSYINNLFESKLDYNQYDRENEKNKSINPLTKKLVKWLKEKINEANTENEIEFLLFHFAKYWNLNFARPYNESKGLILLSDLSNMLDEMEGDMKIDLNSIFEKLNNRFKDVFIDIELPPFLEDKQSVVTNRPNCINGYLTRLESFKSKLLKTDIYKNFEHKTINEMLLLYNDADSEVQKKIIVLIKSQIVNLNLKKYNIIIDIVDQISVNNDSMHLREYLIRRFYLFEKLKFKETENIKINKQHLSYYSEDDLTFFKKLIQKKILEAKFEIDNLDRLLNNKTPNQSIYQMKERTLNFKSNLEKALVRIEEKTYGICRVTGLLIPKERLIAAPHVTLSIEAKSKNQK